MLINTAFLPLYQSCVCVWRTHLVHSHLLQKTVLAAHAVFRYWFRQDCVVQFWHMKEAFLRGEVEGLFYSVCGVCSCVAYKHMTVWVCAIATRGGCWMSPFITLCLVPLNIKLNTVYLNWSSVCPSNLSVSAPHSPGVQALV